MTYGDADKRQDGGVKEKDAVVAALVEAARDALPWITRTSAAERLIAALTWMELVEEDE